MKQIFTMDVEKNIENALKFAKLLKKYNLKGEFYICGYLVEQYPKKCKEISKNHIIGGHGFNHENFARLSIKRQKELIEKTKEVFEKNNIEMKGWRFPYLKFKNKSLYIISKLKIFDSSINRMVLQKWGNWSFVRNWLKNIRDGVIFLPVTYPRNLIEMPWDVTDFGTKEFWKSSGRIIIHCYNYQSFAKDIENYFIRTKR